MARVLSQSGSSEGKKGVVGVGVGVGEVVYGAMGKILVVCLLLCCVYYAYIFFFVLFIQSIIHAFVYLIIMGCFCLLTSPVYFPVCM